MSAISSVSLPTWLQLSSFFDTCTLAVSSNEAANQYQLYHRDTQTTLGSITCSDATDLAFVECFEGKGGITLMVATPNGLRYFILPGGTLTLPGFTVTLAGPPILPSIEERQPVNPGPIQQTTTQAMILGAGLATRFEPVSGDRTQYSKPAVPLVGDRSVIRCIADHLVHHGFHHIMINTFFKPASLKASLNTLSGGKIQYLDEPEPSGTAGMLRKFVCEPETFSGYLDQNKPLFLVLGDAVTDADWSAIVAAHVQNNAAITIGCMKKSDEDVKSFGIVATDQSGTDGQSGNVTLFLEKPTLEAAGLHRLANTGFYVFAPEVYPVIAACYNEMLADAKTKALANGQPAPTEALIDFALDIFPYVLAKAQAGEIKNANGQPMTFWAEMVSGYWNDIGNPVQYIQSVRDIYEEKTGIALPANISDFYDQGVIYWPSTKALAQADKAQLSGNVIVTLPFNG